SEHDVGSAPKPRQNQEATEQPDHDQHAQRAALGDLDVSVARSRIEQQPVEVIDLDSRGIQPERRIDGLDAYQQHIRTGEGKEAEPELVVCEGEHAALAAGIDEAAAKSAFGADEMAVDIDPVDLADLAQGDAEPPRPVLPANGELGAEPAHSGAERPADTA